MIYARPGNTYIPSDQFPAPLPEPDPEELGDGYNVIDKDGRAVAVFADIADAVYVCSNGGGVAVRRHPPRPPKSYVCTTKPVRPQEAPGANFRRPDPPAIVE